MMANSSVSTFGNDLVSFLPVRQASPPHQHFRPARFVFECILAHHRIPAHLRLTCAILMNQFGDDVVGVEKLSSGGGERGDENGCDDFHGGSSFHSPMRIAAAYGAISPELASPLPLSLCKRAHWAGARQMKKTKIIMPAAGLVLFAFVLEKMGWTGVFHQLQVIRKALPILVGLSLLRLALQTFAWSQTLRAEGIGAGMGELIGARVASRGVGYFSVLGPVVAEPMKIRLLRDHSPSVTAATLI